MPRLDGTGPMGQGPMTGRGLGNCRGSAGRLCRWCPFVSGGKAPTKEEQQKLLLEEKEAIEQELSDLTSEK